MTRCSVPNCKYNGSHRFPKDSNLCKKWESIITSWRFQLGFLSDFKAKQHTKICWRHFKPEDYCSMQGSIADVTLAKRQLKKNTVPSIFKLPDSVSSKATVSVPVVPVVPKVVKPITSTDVECRTCLKTFHSNKLLFSLFESWVPPWDGMGNTMADDLAKLTKVELSPLDCGSKHICVGCSRRLKDACHFIAFVQNNDRIQRERHQNLETESPERVWPKPIQVEKNMNVCDNLLSVEVKKEVLSDEENEANEMDYSSREEPCLVNLDIKIEPEEIIQPPPIQVTVNSTVSMGALDQEIAALTNGFTDETYKETEKETEKEKTDKETDKNHQEGAEELQIKQEPASEDEASYPNMEPDLPLKCLLCSKDFNTITGLKAHVIAQHSYKGVKRKSIENPSPEPKQNNKHFCATCRRGFATSTDLMVHETSHSKQECSGCKEKFDTFVLLTSHRARCKMCFKINVRTLSTLQEKPKENHPMNMDSPKNIVRENVFEKTPEFCEQQNMFHNSESTISANEIKTEVIDAETEYSRDCVKPMETIDLKVFEASQSEENSVWSLDSINYRKSEVNNLKNKEGIGNSMDVDIPNMTISESSKSEQNAVLGLASESDIKRELIDLDSENTGLCDNPNQLVTSNVLSGTIESVRGNVLNSVYGFAPM